MLGQMLFIYLTQPLRRHVQQITAHILYFCAHWWVVPYGYRDALGRPYPHSAFWCVFGHICLMSGNNVRRAWQTACNSCIGSSCIDMDFRIYITTLFLTKFGNLFAKSIGLEGCFGVGHTRRYHCKAVTLSVSGSISSPPALFGGNMPSHSSCAEPVLVAINDFSSCLSYTWSASLSFNFLIHWIHLKYRSLIEFVELACVSRFIFVLVFQCL